MAKYKLPVDYTKLDMYQRREVRDQYIMEQSGLCYYCKGSLVYDPPKEILDKPIDLRLFPDNFFRYPIHLQHNHDTGMTEGAVHCHCNAVMWQYEGR